MHSRWWQVVAAVGLVAGIGEVLDSFSIEEPIAALVVAVMFFVGVVLTIRGRLAGPLIVGFLCLIEVVFVPFYPRDSTSDWIIQISFAVLGAIGVAAVVGVLVERRRGAAAGAA